MPSENKRVLPSRAASWNVLSGNISNPSMMRIPLVTNMVRMPLVTGGIPFSMNRGEMHGLKHAGKKQANQQMPENASEKGKEHTCPWCGEGNIARELKSDKRSLWRCLGCNRRWWASADNPRKLVRHSPKLRQKVSQVSIWGKVGGIGFK